MEVITQMLLRVGLLSKDLDEYEQIWILKDIQ